MKRKTRILIAIMSIWTFINAFLLLLNFGQATHHTGSYSYFFPFEKDFSGLLFYLGNYDYSEFFFYGLTPWLVFILYRFVAKKDK